MKSPSALVTGASSGIGRVFAERLAKEGYRLTCVARREGELRSLVDALGEGHRFLAADLTDPVDAAAVCADVRTSRYSLLVNNAGYGIYGPFQDVPLSRLENLIQLNILALVQLTHAFLAGASAGDALINVSSVLSLLPYPGGAVYSATKAFVTNFTEALWHEGKAKGVYVLALLPGITDTAFHRLASGGRADAGVGGPCYPPAVVVRDALDALKARRGPTVITGPRYRLLTALMTRLVSRRTMVGIMGKNGSAAS